MKDYSEQLLNMIATHNGRSDRFKRFKIESNLNKISQLIWERNNRCLNFYTDFASVFEEDTEKFDSVFSNISLIIFTSLFYTLEILLNPAFSAFLYSL